MGFEERRLGLQHFHWNLVKAHKNVIWLATNVRSGIGEYSLVLNIFGALVELPLSAQMTMALFG